VTRLRLTTAMAIIATGLVAAGASPARAGTTVTPEVRIKSARVVGDTTSSASVKKAVTVGRPGLLACYKKDLPSHAGEVGELAMSVRIIPSGKVTTIKVVRSAINADLRNCVFKTIKGWRFTGWKAKGRQYASVELMFQLSGKKPRGATVRGGVPARLVAGSLLTRLPPLLKKCLGGAVLKKRRWPPKLTVIVDYDGTVQTATISGRLPRRTIRKCLLDRVKLWDFPPPDNGHRTWVYWPLVSKAATTKARHMRRPHAL
jgi:TonB family protein